MSYWLLAGWLDWLTWVEEWSVACSRRLVQELETDAKRVAASGCSIKICTDSQSCICEVGHMTPENDSSLISK